MIDVNVRDESLKWSRVLACGECPFSVRAEPAMDGGNTGNAGAVFSEPVEAFLVHAEPFD
jgi:hypothetical protein